MSRRTRRTSDPLVGQYFTIHAGEHDELQYSGAIRARVAKGLYLVVYHDAFMLMMAGIPSEHHREIVPLERMVGWRFCNDVDTFATQYRHAVERDQRRRERGAPERAKNTHEDDQR